ncbi:hypothetical protein [Streptomyces sp. WZ.A104]|uniref:hypothetical protein n=1 Tax=Streptomyces sp. WZ.A104 TaxID=2023771 RepID=UPI0011803EAB|nr:hypothetical protein [Streptomyces sp. WZ.A104]
MSEQTLHPAVARMSMLVETLIRQEQAEKKRAANLRWVVKDVQAAAELDEFPEKARTSFDDLLTLSTWGVYSDLAGAGLTRERHRHPDHEVQVPASNSSMRTRATAWNAVAKFLGRPVRFPLAPKDPPKATVADRQRRALTRELSRPAHTPMSEAGRVRTLAMYGVILDTRARSGELVEMTTHALAPDLSTISLIRRPQGVGEAALPIVETIRLSQFTRAALRAWLDIRAERIEFVEGTKDALWVSLRNNHSGQGRGMRRRPSGMPLQIRGLERAYSRAISQLNRDMPEKESAWTPLPKTVEQLRRSVKKIEIVRLDLAA